MKRFLLIVIALLFAGSFTSCTKINDARLSTLEKSIEKLEQNYKYYAPDKLQKQIERCQKHIESLNQDEDQGKLTDIQRQRLAKLTGKYHRVLIKIKLHTLTNGATEEFGNLLEYIKGILGGE